MAVEDKIVERLKQGPATLTGITSYLELPSSQISVILGKMIAHGIIDTDCGKIVDQGVESGYFSTKGNRRRYVKTYKLVE